MIEAANDPAFDDEYTARKVAYEAALGAALKVTSPLEYNITLRRFMVARRAFEAAARDGFGLRSHEYIEVAETMIADYSRMVAHLVRTFPPELTAGFKQDL